MATKKTAKGYSTESIKKFMAMYNELINHFSGKTEELSVCISKGNRKIGHTMNVSLLPIKTCANCSGCARFCYDIKACLQYPKNVLPARVRNTVLLYENGEKYFSEIEKAIQRRKKNFFFRWHVAGDIPHYNYLANMVRIAKKYPYMTFWTYTKNYSVVNQYVSDHGNKRKTAIPNNLSIMFSEWRGMEMINPYHFPVFTCVFPEENIPRGFHKCSGNCNDCIVNKTGCVIGKSSFTFLH